MRTWDDNRQAINGLWPMAQFTEEERRLWHDDLSDLEQAVLYDAIRNVKRSHDSLYPQLKWVRDEYASLDRLRRLQSRAASATSAEPVPVVRIDAESNARMRDELKIVVDMATPADYDDTVKLIADKAAKCQIEMSTAFRLVRYLLERLGMSRGGIIRGAA